MWDGGGGGSNEHYFCLLVFIGYPKFFSVAAVSKRIFSAFENFPLFLLCEFVNNMLTIKIKSKFG